MAGGGDCCQTLVAAVEHGDLQEVQRLLQAGVSCDLETIDGEPILHRVIGRGQTNVARLLVAGGAMLNRYSADGEMPLHVAVSERNQEMVELLLQGGANINLPTAHNESALYIAASEGHSELTRILLDHGAEPDMSNYSGETPLFVAASKRNTEVVDVLLEKGARVDVATSEGLTPLHAAALQRDPHMVATFLQHGADVQAKNREGGTALHTAVRHGDVPMVKMLLAANADVNAVDKSGTSPVHVAVKERYRHILKMLLERGARLHEMDQLIHIALHERNQAMVHDLIEAGANLNITNWEHGLTPLGLAAQMGYVGVVEHLLRCGADVQKLTVDLKSPLHIAVLHQQVGVTRTLLAHDADPNLPDGGDETPLLAASRKGPVELLKLLVSAGANINIVRLDTDHEKCLQVFEMLKGLQDIILVGNTPLLCALSRGRCDLAEYLLTLGPNLNVVDTAGQGMVHWSAYHCLPQLTHSLLLAGAHLNLTNVQALRPLDLLLRAGAHEQVMSLQQVLSTFKVLLQHGSLLHPQSLLGAHPAFVANGLRTLTDLWVLSGALPPSAKVTTPGGQLQQERHPSHQAALDTAQSGRQPYALTNWSRMAVRAALREADCGESRGTRGGGGLSMWGRVLKLPVPRAMQQFLLLHEYQTVD